jgi:hypothetical protein
MKNSEMTMYSKLYDGTYWSNFKSSEDKSEIYDNRNRFKEEYNIKKYIRCPPRYILKETYNNTLFDHVEHYRTNNRTYIIVSSPYAPNVDELYESIGWTKIYKLYTNSATTYIKILPLKR